EIRSDRDIYFLKHKKKKMSVCIAVGIYSLLNGLEIRSKQDFPYIPKGKKLDLGKYITEKGTYYFMEAR
ncbi:MAG TPA: N-acetylmuramoyl-L-alanine amidase, partial [Leptospiraceae bacterium]|nr:N-acetylmuramoyl-L-alanine amidase [Leptospiraceae bacterium]